MKYLSSFQLKIIAIVTMTIDHIGYHLYPETDLYRIIGRICFPLIAFLLAEGYKHTSNFGKYLYRLLSFAAVIQVVLYFTGEVYVNIFFTLACGLILIYGIEKRQYMIASSVLLIPFLVPLDYGYYGVLMIPLMYFSGKYMVVGFIALNVFFIEIISQTAFFTYALNDLQYYSILALPLILVYNGLEGKKMKYFFYFYYPFHIVVILIIKELFYV